MLRLVATLLSVVFVLAAVPRSARADATADEADFRFRHAAQLYRQGRIEEALGEFLGSNRLVRNRNVIFNIARCFEQLKRFNEAFRFYAEVSDDAMPEGDRKELSAALQRLKPSLALLTVESEPPGATVYIDRKDLGGRGQTPLTLALPAGKAVAFIELDGYRPAQAEVQLAVGKTALAQAPLQRIYGTLEAEGDPARYELRLDASGGEPVLTKNGAAQVVPGRHILHVSAPGHVGQQLAIEVPAGGAVQAKFKLLPIPPPSGTLVVKANIDGALVRIDGKEVGFTPGVIENILTGTRKVELFAEGREPLVRQVEFKQGERSFLDARLRYAQPRVVAAERRLTRAEDAPASITVISGDEVRGFGYATLSEALHSVRGLYTSSDRDYDSIGVRGFSTPGTYNNRVLVLSDGHVTNELAYGQGYVGRDFDPDLSDIERIEIVRGPGSVLYGSAAFFAVVNVVHRAPPPGTHARLSSTLGTLGENAGHASASVATDTSYLWVRAAGVNLAGESLFLSPLLAGPGSGLARNLDQEQAGHVDLRARLGDLTLSASYNSRRKEIPTAPFGTRFGVEGTRTIDRRGYLELAYNHAAENGFAVEARAAYDAARYNGDWQYQAGYGYDSNSEDWATGELRVRLPTVLNNRIFAGAELQDRFRIRVTSFAPNRPTFDNSPGNGQNLPDHELVASGYLGDEITLGKRVRLNAAVRLDDHLDSFGTVLNPRIALIVQPYDDGTTKLLYGTAFRAPGFSERYYTDSLTQTQAHDLQPERVATAELEHTHQLTDEVSFQLGGYYSRIEGLIGAVPLGDGTIQLQNQPGLVHSSGVEAEVRWQPAPGALLSFWYAYARVRDSAGNPVANSPEHTAAARFLYPVIPSALSFSTELAYGSARRTVEDLDNPVQLVGETLRWNVGVAGAYTRWGIRYGAFVQNLLDEKISQPGGAEIPFAGHAVPQLGRTLRLQIAGTF